MAKKLTATQRANLATWNKEIKRIKQFIRRAEKRGYKFDEDIVPEKPKRLTKKSVERIRKIKPEDLYKKSIFVDPETGEVIPGKEGKKRERENRKKRRETPDTQPPTPNYPSLNIIDEIKRRVMELPDYKYVKGYGRSMIPYDITDKKSGVVSMLDERILIAESSRQSYYEYIDYLLSVQEEIFSHFDNIQFKASRQEEVEQSFNRIFTLILGRSLNSIEAKEIEELNDYYNVWNEPE